jgi:hypothetical protein
MDGPRIPWLRYLGNVFASGRVDGAGGSCYVPRLLPVVCCSLLIGGWLRRVPLACFGEWGRDKVGQGIGIIDRRGAVLLGGTGKGWRS